MERVIDFGHAKQIFPDADVFPSILVVRKPTDEPGPAGPSVHSSLGTSSELTTCPAKRTRRAFQSR